MQPSVASARTAVTQRGTRDTRRRALAASVAVLCVAMQGATIAHLLLARHVVCPEHGELVHADGDQLAAARGHQALAAPAPAGRAIGSAHDASAAEHSDEHCAVVASRREHAVVSAPAQQLIAPLASDAASLPPHAEQLIDGRARYDLAPKQSPPA